MINIELQIALITAISSLIIAIIGLVASLITSHQSAKSLKMIEELKFKFSRDLEKEKLGYDRLKELDNFLKIAITTVQRVKDTLQIVISNSNNNLFNKDVLATFKDVRREVFKTYEDSGCLLDEKDKRIFHRIKNITYNIEIYLTDFYEDNSNAGVSDTELRKLFDFREELSDLQQLLSLNRSELLIRMLDNEQ